MNRNPQLPLTETVFYILHALREPAHGYLIMSRVDGPDPRRKVYQITDTGRQILCRRLGSQHY